MSPPYACSCCGFVNGDMFHDWLNGRKPTEQERIDFEVARRMFWAKVEMDRAKAKKQVESKKPRKPYTKRSDYWKRRKL